MKKIAFITVLMMTLLVAHAQKVTFYSPEFEEGVRYHIGLSEADDVLQTQMDTITCLSLSGLEITDLRDVVYLSGVTKLDLSYNKIKDVSPLLSLGTLRVLNLSNNKLESIDILAFMQSESLEVDVTNNYISDFSYFFIPTQCDFTFKGMGVQQEKGAPYFDVGHLYAEVNDDGQPVISYCGFTNMDASDLAYETSNMSAQMDGSTYLVAVPNHTSEAYQVKLSCGEYNETTYLVPPSDYTVEAGKTVTLTTGLPEGYSLSHASAEVGAVEIVGNTIKYTATADAAPDIIHFIYYQGDTLKGFSRYWINRKYIAGDANGDGMVNVADVVEIVNCVNGKTSARFDRGAANVSHDKIIDSTDLETVVNMIVGVNGKRQ